jgi:hypothetical protein
MWLRINLMKPIGFVDRVVLSYRRHAANASQGVWKMRRGRFDVAKSIYETCSMNAAQERIFWRSLSVGCHIYWAVDYLRRRQPMMAVRHVAHAAHNLVQYHVLPKFSRNVSGEDAIHE